ncbi:poly-beta-hydroxybutyrate polymerase [Sphingomonas sp. Leaf231]|uniref:alpha/beta hydrolase n=1 Tax=Sphingomonas sp. Leaf231 TaxID=1736301 RepID=UPI0007022EAE|nr:alpha/beta hydrolase [Sphingomonas sp. Leaf231]KQN92751.1 poly-beta-hydroxybutyrate polymerase [Sphingomonas sp. Leaf231]
MTEPLCGIAQNIALQHRLYGPRPLPLFLDMLRRETATSPERTAAALAGLRRYQDAPRRRRRARPVRYRSGAARLRDGARGSDAPPVVLIPSLINPPFVLDLAPGHSLLEHLAAAGFHPWLVDWGTPRAQDAGLDLAGHVTRRLLPLLARLPRPPLLVGYCLGGTLALAAAAALPPGTVAGVATIAAPWRFGGYGDAPRDALASLWAQVAPGCRALGVVPMEVLQTVFWQLDPARTIAKYAAFATMAPAAAARFVLLEDWANDGAPLAYAAGADMFEGLFAADRPGRGRWTVDGTIVVPHDLPCPATEFVSLTDRIVPAATAIGLPSRHDIHAGHVGMMVGGRARNLLWDPLTAWLHAHTG